MHHEIFHSKGSLAAHRCACCIYINRNIIWYSLGSGDIVEDMSSQVKANTIRIHLLTQQNHGLTQSIQKITNLQQTTDYQVNEHL